MKKIKKVRKLSGVRKTKKAPPKRKLNGPGVEAEMMKVTTHKQ